MARLLQPGEHGGLLGAAWKLPPLWVTLAGAQDVLRAAGQALRRGSQGELGALLLPGPAWAP